MSALAATSIIGGIILAYYSCDTAPSVPTKLIAEALSNDQIKITWGPVADNGGADVNYFLLKIINKDSGIPECDDTQIRGDQMVATHNGLKKNTDYR